MALIIYDKMKRDGNLPFVSTSDVEMSNGSRLDEYLEELETPATSVDLSKFDTTGVITETHADGTVVTYTMTFDENGNPTTIMDSRGYLTTLTW